MARRPPKQPPSNVPRAGRKLSEVERLEVVLEAGRLWTRRKTTREIAAILKVSQPTAWRLVKRAEEYYLAQAGLSVADRIEGELRTLAETEKEAWTAWERSIGKKRSTSVRTIAGGRGRPRREDSREEVEMYGDPQFLVAILTVSRQRAKLLGLNAPEKFEADIGVIFRRALGRAAELAKHGPILTLPPAQGG